MPPRPSKDVKGLYLLTDYPAVSVRPGTTSTVSLRLQNYGLPPERFALSVDGTPAGWTATLLGGGQPVAAAMPATDQSVSLQLRLDVPANADLCRPDPDRQGRRARATMSPCRSPSISPRSCRQS